MLVEEEHEKIELEDERVSNDKHREHDEENLIAT